MVILFNKWLGNILLYLQIISDICNLKKLINTDDPINKNLNNE